MRWFLALSGRKSDLRLLENLCLDDPWVTELEFGIRFLASSKIDGAATSQEAYAFGKELLVTANGIAAFDDAGFQPVQLSGQILDTSNESVSSVIEVETIEAKATIGGISASSDLLRTALAAPKMADIAQVMTLPEPLQSRLYKSYELLCDEASGERAIISRQLATASEFSRFRAWANHPGIGGEKARHVVAPPGGLPKKAMDDSEALAFIHRLATQLF